MQALIDIKSEETALGTLLSNPKEVDATSVLIQEKSYSNTTFRLIATALRKIIELGKPINDRILSIRLEELGLKEDEVTRIIDRINAAAMTPEYLPELARKLKRASTAREIIASVDHAKRIIEGGDSVEEAIEHLNKCLESFDEPDQNFESDMRIELDKTVERVRMRSKGELTDTGYPTGIEGLDTLISIRPMELIIIGARPGVGKTAIMKQIRINLITSGGLRTGFISLEMSSEQMSERAAANIGRIPLSEIQGRFVIEESSVDSLKQSIQVIPYNQNPECTKPDMTIQSIRALARRWKRSVGIDVLMIDYSQLIEGPKESRGRNRVEVVSEISRGLKLMAKELGIPVITASQLSRGSEESARPSLRHLRESGSIEQDADTVILLYDEEINGVTNTKAIVAKNRSGKCGECQLNYAKQFQIIK